MDIKRIILSSIYGKLPESGEKALQEWLSKGNNRKLYEHIRRNLEERDAVAFLAETDTEGALRRVRRRLRRPVAAVVSAVSGVAAAVAVAFVLWQEEPAELPVAESKVVCTTITLASGQVLQLDGGEVEHVSEDACISVSGERIAVSAGEKADTVKEYPYNVLDVPHGQHFSITLSDGTRVWVNALSQLKFPASFEGAKERRVELAGEGYFEVARNERQPFRVITDRQTVVVTGTAFNVSAYAGETSRTTLCSGRVTVEIAGGEEVPLLPGQQLLLGDVGEAQLVEVDAERYKAWVDGIYYFDEKTLAEVFTELGKWFDIREVSYIHPSLEHRLFSGKLLQKDGLDVILQVVEKGSRSRIRNEEGHIRIGTE